VVVTLPQLAVVELVPTQDVETSTGLDVAMLYACDMAVST
jgi:hypothetical protein